MKSRAPIDTHASFLWLFVLVYLVHSWLFLFRFGSFKDIRTFRQHSLSQVVC